MKRQPIAAPAANDTSSGSGTALKSAPPMTAYCANPPVRRPGAFAQVRIAGVAEPARPAPVVEWREHAHSGLDQADICPDLFDDAGLFVAEDCGHGRLEPDPRPVALPDVPVAPGDAAGHDLDEDIARAHPRDGHIADLQRELRTFHNNRLHFGLLSWVWVVE
ncbi:MAG: hypothetical protein M9925_11765 [Chloroflexi bacterium]|nr:hypothetical protein [Chloroflexota bacterium]MCZ7576923.1 hypothetical protein [Dehalococcoidia bacterium]